ncbi:MAG TPA: c-type cytochrome [Gammaproteobacteria bacterium]
MTTHEAFGRAGRPAAILLACLTAACEPADERPPAPEAAPDAALAQRVLNASPYTLRADPELAAYVQRTAEAAIAEHCAVCHGADLTGRPGVPNLVDFDWLWGITLEETTEVEPVMKIEQTIRHGIRNQNCPLIADQALYGGCPDTRYSEMPGYLAGGMFDASQVDDLVEWVLSLSGRDADPEAVERAQAIRGVCAECHGPEGYGYKPYGGPDLTDDVWLYGSDRETIRDVIANGRLGMCPAWGETLDAPTIKSLALYIWQKANEG